MASSSGSLRPADSTGGATSASRGIWGLVVACALAIAGCSWSWAATASAAPTIPAKLVWQGSVCGTAENFASRVLERTGAVRFVQRGHRLSVRLRIERRSAGLAASVSIEGRGRAPLRRQLASPDCDDALDALALVVAIGIEATSTSAAGASATKAKKPALVEPPSSSAHDVPPTTSAPALPTDSGPASAPPSSASVPPAVGENASPPPTPALAPLSQPAPLASSPAGQDSLPAVSPSSATTESRLAPAAAAPEARDLRVDSARSGTSGEPGPFRLGAGLSGRLSLGIAPEPMLGGAIWIATGWRREGPWSPELVLSATHQRLDGLAVENGQVDFVLSAAAVAVCPLRIGRSALAVRPCAEASIGRLFTEAHDTYDPESKDRPWGALGGALEFTGALGVVELRATLAASAPLVRDRFRFGAECSGSACEADVFHRVASVIWSGAAGAGVVFW